MIYGGVTQRTCSCQASVLRYIFVFSLKHFVCAGAPLWKILQAGEWRSPAFLKYLDLHRLETDVVVQAHIDESDCEEEDPNNVHV